MSFRRAFPTALALLIACSEHHRAPASSDAGLGALLPGACSEGPAWQLDDLQQGRWEDAGSACTPRCAAEAPSSWRGLSVEVYGADALPSGTCSPAGAPCQLDIGLPCNGDPRAIWVRGLCRCEGGAWACEASYMGGGICPTDAGVAADAGALPADCDGLDQADCIARAGCTMVHAFAAAAPQAGAGYLTCQRIGDSCRDGVLRCAADAAGALWAVDSCNLPSGLSTRSRAECSSSLPELPCEDLSPEQCAAAPLWCRVLKGRPKGSDGTWLPLGCMTIRGGCTELAECARDGRGGPDYGFPDGCIPKGWELCPPRGGTGALGEP